MGSKEDEALKSIGWDEESWKLNPNCEGGEEPKFITRRLDDSDWCKVTNNVIFIMLNKVSRNFMLLYNILCYLLPTGILPASVNAFRKQLQKRIQSKPRRLGKTA